MNIQIIGEEQVPISLLCYVYPNLVYRVKIISVFLIQLFLTNSLIFMKGAPAPLIKGGFTVLSC